MKLMKLMKPISPVIDKFGTNLCPPKKYLMARF